MQDWPRLARRITTRRMELGYTSREALAEASGIALRTLDSLERADEREYIQPKTVARLEKVLELPAGEIARTLAGLDEIVPQPVEGADVTVVAGAAPLDNLLEQIVLVRKRFGDDVARAFVDGAFARPVEPEGGGDDRGGGLTATG